ncbi:MAG TPA: hypothetical protein VEX38_03040 [Fimbriimonadaceae bacterium]|nr:hypothetical protein [Fimbriimonadaceae bacterium]
MLKLFSAVTGALFASLLALLLPNLPQGSTQNHPDDPERFLGVKEWRLVMTWKAAPRRHQTKDEVMTAEYALQEYSGSLTLKLSKPEPYDAPFPIWSEWSEAKGEVIHKGSTTMTPKEGKPTLTQIVTSGLQRDTANGSLNIDLKAGTYQVTGGATSASGSMTVDAEGVKSKFDVPAALIFPLNDSGQPKSYPLPRFGLTITGGDSYELAVFPMDGSQPGLEPVKVNVTWTLSPWDQQEGQVYLEKVADNYIPEPGNRTTVRLSIENGQMTEVKFTLYDVSNWKGENASKGQSTEPDLKLDPDSGYSIKQQDPKTWIASGSAPHPDKASMDVLCSDGAAIGKVKAEAKVNGKWVVAKAREGGGGLVEIPVDKNKNKIADQWERDELIEKDNRPSNWDEEEVFGNPNKGDGIALFDEYRGFEGRNGYVRFSATMQDLVAFNEIGDMAGPGLRLLSDAANIMVRDFGKRDKSDKQVVKNRSPYSLSQAGVILRADSGTKGGKTLPENLSPKPSPKYVDACIVMVQLLSPMATLPTERRLESLRYTVAHELGHSINLEHHGEIEVTNFGHKVKVGEANRHILDPQGRDLREYDERGNKRPTPVDYDVLPEEELGVPHGKASGDIMCIMCYNMIFDWCWYRYTANQGEWFFRVPQLEPANRLCTSGKGTGINADGKYFGDAEKGKGNCRSKFKVKD